MMSLNIKKRKDIYIKNCKKHGRIKYTSAVVTCPIWLPIFVAMNLTGIALESLGEWLQRVFAL